MPAQAVWGCWAWRASEGTHHYNLSHVACCDERVDDNLAGVVVLGCVYRDGREPLWRQRGGQSGQASVRASAASPVPTRTRQVLALPGSSRPPVTMCEAAGKRIQSDGEGAADAGAGSARPGVRLQQTGFGGQCAAVTPSRRSPPRARAVR